MKRALVIANPAAGSGRARRWLPRVREALGDAGYGVRSVETSAAGQAREAAAREGAGADLAVSVGGDGTLNEVLNGIAGFDVPLAVIPAGTANVLAKELGIGGSLPRALAAVAGGRIERVDLGAAGGRRFLLMAGVGFDADIIRELENIRNGNIGFFTYVGPALRAWGRYPGPGFTVARGGAAPEFGRVYFAAFGNVRSYGGPFELTPRASMRDGLLDFCGFSGGRKLDLLRYYGGALLGLHPLYRDCSYARGVEFEVREPGLPVQVDGEFAGRTPVRVTVLPAAQRLVVPRAWRDRGARIIHERSS